MKRNCEICRQSETKVVFKQEFILPTKNYFHSGYKVSICNNCDFAFADGIQSQEQIDKYYREMTKKTFLIKKMMKFDKKIHLDFLNKQYDVSKKNILKYVKKNDRVLDIGCYTGNLLYLLKESGFKNVEGLDLSKFAADVGSKRFGVKIHVGSFFDQPKIGSFDFIILTHVLEHIKDLDKFIRNILPLMNNGGKIYIETPDAHNFFIPDDNDRRFSNDQKEPFLQFSVEHINYFSKHSLTNLMSNRGYGVIDIRSQLSHIAIITSVWEKNSLIKDSQITPKLKKYVADSMGKLKNVKNIINKLLISKEVIYVWGAGLHTQKLLALTNLKKTNIKAFIDVDSNYYGGKLINRAIIPTKNILKNKNIPILISSKSFQSDIVNQIKLLKLPNRIITLY